MAQPVPETADGREQELELWTLLAQDGDAEAQFNLGVLFAGSTDPEERQQALGWLEQAAEQDHSGAQYRLGVLYFEGRGIASDAARAVHWWQRAAANDHTLAQRRLAEALQFGIGTRKDVSQALHWFGEAAKAGDLPAQTMLERLQPVPATVPDKPVAAARPPETNEWLFAQPSNGFTIQVISSRQRTVVEEFGAQKKLGEQARILKTTVGGQTWWYLVYGSFVTREDAIAATIDLGLDIDDTWVRNFGVLQRKRCEALAATEDEPLAELVRWCEKLGRP